MKGKVKWYNNTKNYGFIEVEGGGKDVFVHMSALEEGVSIREGDPVEFDIEEAERGPQATNVKKTEE